ncbi:MAG: autotransporter outer membrane beta-barrel domain-containing protein [Formosimonas sp.]
MIVKHQTLALSAIAASLACIPSNAWALCADYGADGSAFASTASASDGSVCTLSRPSYSGNGAGTQVISVHGAGTELSAVDTIVQSSTSNVGGARVSAGGSLISTGLLNINVNNVGQEALHFQDAGTTGKLNNLSITDSQNSGDWSFGVVNSAKVSVAGHTQVTLTNAVNGSAIESAESPLNNQSELNLNTVQVSVSGSAAKGIVSSERGVLKAFGQANVRVDGVYNTGVMAYNGGDLALLGGGSIVALGNQSMAVALISNKIDGRNQPPEPNHITLNNYQLSAAQGSVIRVAGGASTLNLNQTKASASAGQKLLFVSNGSDLPTRFGLTANSAQLIVNANASTLSGDAVVSADGSTANFNLSNGTIYTGAMSNISNATVDASSIWNVTNHSNLTQGLANSGQINFQNIAHTLTIGGNYIGTAGSVIHLETQLGDDNSPTDRVHVLGNTSGTTRLSVHNAGGVGAQTLNGINLVQVDGTSAADSFTMAAPLQAGSYEYVLKQGACKKICVNDTLPSNLKKEKHHDTENSTSEVATHTSRVG